MQEDYVIRLIRQFVDAIARIAGFRKRGEYERASAEIGRAWEELGVPRELVLATDGETLAALLRDADKQRVAAELLAEEAHVVHAKGDPLHAGALRMRAIELLVRARAKDADLNDDAQLAEIGRHLAPADLASAMDAAHTSRA